MASSEVGVLAGTFALVTGSRRRIGRCTALALAAAGAAAVAVHGREAEEEECRAVVREIEKLGTQALFVAGDIADPEQVAMIVQRTLDTFGRLDILVNNAGGSQEPMEPFWEISLEKWHYEITINLTATFLFSKHVAPQMIRQGSGCIVNISSTQARYAVRPAYGSAKAGIEQFTRCCAAELGPYGVRVNCIAPGAITLARDPSPSHVTPLGYQGIPEDIAGVVVFLCSQAATYVTGQTITVDGGRTCLAPRG